MSFEFGLYRLFFRIWLNIMYKIEYRNYEHVNEKITKGTIVAANHYSNYDPVILTFKIKKQVFFMAKQELFNTPFKNWFFKSLGAFPVIRGKKADTSAIDTAVKVIKEDKLLGLFPEGTRSKDGNLLRPKSGIALIAQKTKADIFPIGITYENKKKFRSKAIIHYGEIIKNEELNFSEEVVPRELKRVSMLVMDKIKNLRHMDEF